MSGMIPETPNPDQPYVFISYQRDSEAEARLIYEHLDRAGFNVWLDVEDIRHSARWQVTINEALHKADRLVLLLTRESMESPEVFNEWAFCYSERKPIHCLLLETCDIFYSLRPFQYLDWREPANRDWDRLDRELRMPFEWPALAKHEKVINSPFAPVRTLPQALEALKKVVRSDTRVIALNDSQIEEIVKHRPTNLTEYCLGCIAEWSLPRYQLDNRFVQLSLLVEQDKEAQGPGVQERVHFHDLRAVLAETTDCALVLLGAPGSGKSTLLRRLELDLAVDQVCDDSDSLTFFIQLNQYHAPAPGAPMLSPSEWLAKRWHDRVPDLPPLPDLLREGRMLLLLDALNEMPHRNGHEYRERIDLWKHFLLETLHDCPGNRVVFSCRSLDYSAPLSSPDLSVSQVQIEPMDDARIQQFLAAYLPPQAESIWRELQGSPQLELFRTPYFLRLLLDQVEAHQAVPKGRAGLFTGFVRQTLRREIESGNRLFEPDSLLTDYDWGRLVNNQWRDEHDLPEEGILLPRLSRLAFLMQASRIQTEGAQVRIKRDQARTLLDHDRSADILRAGTELSVLDEDRAQQEVMFFHQLLQEYFAARKLAAEPKPDLVRVMWHVDQLQPSLADTLAHIDDSDPLPPPPGTGWEETTVLAAAMSADPETFIRGVMDANLPLAARCAAAQDVHVVDDLCDDIRARLLARMREPAADLRARIAAGLALGEVGDPRFERYPGPDGDYLLPLLITIPGGEYTLGSNDGHRDDEKPVHKVKLETFKIGKFPITNAEYALFIAAHGYDDERWWRDTKTGKAWRSGKGTSEGQKQQSRENRGIYQEWIKTGEIRKRFEQGRITSKQADDWEQIAQMGDDVFEALLEEWYPTGRQTLPRYWNDSNYNNPSQPVVGLCWYEARAYCAWLTAQVAGSSGAEGKGAGTRVFRLPTEAEWEAAARGKMGRRYPYGNEFDVKQSNTSESHIRRTTPVGIFPGGETPEGLVDMSGNVWDWTSSAYKPYPYRMDDGREDPTIAGEQRVLRGGAWNFDQYLARHVWQHGAERSDSNVVRAAYRNWSPAIRRGDNLGFRVVTMP